MRHFGGRRKYWLAPLFLIGLALLVFVTMHLWNSLMPGIFHLPLINYWQAAGLLILARLLFGFGGHHRSHQWNYRHSHLHERWAQMTPEERLKFKEHWKDHCHYWDRSKDEKVEHQ